MVLFYSQISYVLRIKQLVRKSHTSCPDRNSSWSPGCRPPRRTDTPIRVPRIHDRIVGRSRPERLPLSYSFRYCRRPSSISMVLKCPDARTVCDWCESAVRCPQLRRHLDSVQRDPMHHQRPPLPLSLVDYSSYFDANNWISCWPLDFLPTHRWVHGPILPIFEPFLWWPPVDVPTTIKNSHNSWIELRYANN